MNDEFDRMYWYEKIKNIEWYKCDLCFIYFVFRFLWLQECVKRLLCTKVGSTYGIENEWGGREEKQSNFEIMSSDDPSTWPYFSHSSAQFEF